MYTVENLEMLDRGCANMQHHIRNALKFGVSVVVAVNVFATDSPREIELVKQKALEAGATAAVGSTHWSDGGKGAKQLGRAVVTACEKMRARGSLFKFLYPLEFTIEEKFKVICSTSSYSRPSSSPTQACTLNFVEPMTDVLPLCKQKKSTVPMVSSSARKRRRNWWSTRNEGMASCPCAVQKHT